MLVTIHVLADTCTHRVCCSPHRLKPGTVLLLLAQRSQRMQHQPAAQVHSFIPLPACPPHHSTASQKHLQPIVRLARPWAAPEHVTANPGQQLDGLLPTALLSAVLQYIVHPGQQTFGNCDTLQVTQWTITGHTGMHQQGTQTHSLSSPALQQSHGMCGTPCSTHPVGGTHSHDVTHVSTHAPLQRGHCNKL